MPFTAIIRRKARCGKQRRLTFHKIRDKIPICKFSEFHMITYQQRMQEQPQQNQGDLIRFTCFYIVLFGLI